MLYTADKKTKIVKQIHLFDNLTFIIWFFIYGYSGGGKRRDLCKSPFAQLSIRQTRRPGPLAEGQVKAACAPAVVPAWPGQTPSVIESSG